MIRVHFTPEDLAEIRLPFPPPLGLVMSAMKALKNPAKHALHLPWVQEARTAIDGRDLGILFALTSGSHYVPDFVTPPPTTPFPGREQHLALWAGTPAERVRIELDKLVDAIDGEVPEPVRLMAEDPA